MASTNGALGFGEKHFDRRVPRGLQLRERHARAMASAAGTHPLDLVTKGTSSSA